MIANTDVRHYLSLTEQVYRFLPYKLTKNDIKSIHGNDENVSLKNLYKSFKFYILLIISSNTDHNFKAKLGRKAQEL